MNGDDTNTPALANTAPGRGTHEDRFTFRVSRCEKQQLIGVSKVEPFYCYRDRTQALLRRYFRMSMQIGRLPALLGREVFPARVTSYRMTTFEDAVILVHDVERCLARLDEDAQELIAHIVFEQYTLAEVARLMHLRLTTVYERYERALDLLSRAFLQNRMLTPMGERPKSRSSKTERKRSPARIELEACQAPQPQALRYGCA